MIALWLAIQENGSDHIGYEITGVDGYTNQSGDDFRCDDLCFYTNGFPFTSPTPSMGSTRTCMYLRIELDDQPFPQIFCFQRSKLDVECAVIFNSVVDIFTEDQGEAVKVQPHILTPQPLKQPPFISSLDFQAIEMAALSILACSRFDE